MQGKRHFRPTRELLFESVPPLSYKGLFLPRTKNAAYLRGLPPEDMSVSAHTEGALGQIFPAGILFLEK